MKVFVRDLPIYIQISLETLIPGHKVVTLATAARCDFSGCDNLSSVMAKRSLYPKKEKWGCIFQSGAFQHGEAKPSTPTHRLSFTTLSEFKSVGISILMIHLEELCFRIFAEK
jgi:hypothetical protein